MTEVYTHQDMISMAEEAVSALRSTSDVDAVHDIKKLQDTLRAQYERAQFEFRETLKKRKRELKNLEDQANEPHEAEFEAKRAELEETHFQLEQTIKDLTSSITEHEENRKKSRDELQQLSAKETELKRKKALDDSITDSLISLFGNITSITWDLDASDISGTAFFPSTTKSFHFSPDPSTNVCNQIWNMIDDEMGFEWD